MPYIAVQQLLDPANPQGMHNYWSGDFLTGLPDEAIDALVAHAQPPASPLTQIIIVTGGGAIARVGEDETAFGQRHAPFNLHYLSMWPPDHAEDQRNIDFTRDAGGGDEAVDDRERLPELHRRRGPDAGGGGLRAGEVRTPAGDQGRLGPRRTCSATTRTSRRPRRRRGPATPTPVTAADARG